MLTDFGLSRTLEGDLGLTQTGTFLGTPHFASPEQLRGESVDARSDLYSLGALLYELATGVPAFDDRNPLVLVQRILSDAARPPREVDPEISRFYEAVVLRLLGKHPAARFPSAPNAAAPIGTRSSTAWVSFVALSSSDPE